MFVEDELDREAPVKTTSNYKCNYQNRIRRLVDLKKYM